MSTETSTDEVADEVRTRRIVLIDDAGAEVHLIARAGRLATVSSNSNQPQSDKSRQTQIRISAWLGDVAAFVCGNGGGGAWLRTKDVFDALAGSGIEIPGSGGGEAAAHQAIGRRMAQVFCGKGAIKFDARGRSCLVERRRDRDPKTRTEFLEYCFKSKALVAAEA